MATKRGKARPGRRTRASVVARARAKLAACEEQRRAILNELRTAIYGSSLLVDPESAPLEPLGAATSGFEGRYLARALEATDGDPLAAARVLEISRSTIYRLIEQHGLRSLLRGH